MDLNKLSQEVHSNAVKHGFWDEKYSNEHCLMLIITEIGEMVEADRKNQRANLSEFNKLMNYPKTSHEAATDDEIFSYWFESYIKDSIEDEMADIFIRLLDLAGELGIDFDKMGTCRYFRAFHRFKVSENAFGLAKGLTREAICIEKRILFGLNYVEMWAKDLGIDLEWHVSQKMKYNKTRPIRHNKQY